MEILPLPPQSPDVSGTPVPPTEPVRALQPPASTELPPYLPPGRPRSEVLPLTWGAVLVVVVVSSFLSSVLGVSVYDRYWSPRIVAVDLDGHLREIREAGARGMPESDQDAALRTLQDTLARRPTREIVLRRDAVVQNVAEILLPHLAWIPPPTPLPPPLSAVPAAATTPDAPATSAKVPTTPASAARKGKS